MFRVFFTPVKGVLWLWATHSHYYGLNFACLVCASWAFSLCPCLFLGHFVFAGRVIIPSSLWSIESTVSSSYGHCAPLSKIVKKLLKIFKIFKKMSKLLKKCQNCKTMSKILSKGQHLSKIVKMLVRSCFLITLIKSKVFWVALCMSSSKVLTDWQGHLLSCSGQLKK